MSLSKTSSRRDSMEQLPNMRLVLLGKNVLENGRVGNLILGRDAFRTEDLEVSLEYVSERVQGQVEGRPITVINTPDLFDPQRTQHELSEAVEECVVRSPPGSHVFLLVLQPDFSEEDRREVKSILNLFSNEAMNYTIVLTTVRSVQRVSTPDAGEKEDPLGLIIQECKMRHQEFDKIRKFSQVPKLFEKIDEMMEENGRRHLTCETIGEPGGSLLPESKQTAKRGRESDSHEEEERKKKRKGEIKEIAAIQQAQDVMKRVKYILEEEIKPHAKTNTKFMNFIRSIMDLDLDLLDETIQKTTIGVFGKTGGGKSSLINAILDEEELLPTGSLIACTSVIIQVEAGVKGDLYTAAIEFISEEAWENELKSLVGFLAEPEERDENICNMAEDKIKALYGEDATSKSFEELMKDDRSTVIADMLSTTKTISHDKASELSEEIRPYVRHDVKNIGKLFWPVVKTVRIGVRDHKKLLQNIVLVDLPGTGDCNQTRDEMWRSMSRKCTDVWVVSDINRAVSDKAAWEILKSSMTDMVQAGACTGITFICTKTDDMDSKEYMRQEGLNNEALKITADNKSEIKRKCILHRNNKAQKEVKKKFEKQCQIQKYYIKNISEVFTVSSREFYLKEPCLEKDDTEIPKLREVLRNLNDSHTNRMASQYVNRATGILSLIQTSKESNMEMNMDKAKLHSELKKKLEDELKCLRDRLEPCYSELETCLSDGVIKSEMKCAAITKKNVEPPAGKDGRGFHKTLAALCRNEGYIRSHDGEMRDLNKSLAEIMHESINEKFNALFPNEGETSQSVREKVKHFSVCSIRVTEGYSNPAAMNLILRFLKAEEDKLKRMRYGEIAQQKREIYALNTDTIKKEMVPGYKEADDFAGKGSMVKKQRILIKHTESLKGTMFNKAKDRMLTSFKDLKEKIEDLLRKELLKAMAHVLTESNFPFKLDVSAEIETLEKLSAPTDE